MNYPFWLVLMDADHIQDYIFGTNRLKEIRGASLLLDRLNLSDSRDLLIPYRGEEVFIGGGGILAAFPDEARARGYMNAVGALYLRSTSTATITGAAMEVRSSTHERDALCQARFELRLAKAARRQTEPILTSPYFRLCRSCGRYPATAHDSDAELCAVCAAKRRTAEELQPDDTASGAALTTFPTYSGYGKFARRAAQPPYDDPRWLDLSRVPAQLDRLEGHDTVHIGVIHADVNGLGAMLEAQDSLAAVHSLGLNVEAALEAALVEAARTVHLEPDVRHNRWPFLIIIMGGDDLTLIVPAGRAVALANALCLAFEGQIREKLGEAPGAAGNQKPQLALSAGVVIAKPKHPAYALADLAEQLTRNAKRLSHELKLKGFGPVPTLDFQVIHTATANPIEQVRANEYRQTRGGQEYRYTTRPLPCHPIGHWPGTDTLLAAIRNLRRNDFPRNKLNEWSDLIYKNDAEQILDWQTLQTRVVGDAKEALKSIVREFGLSERSLFAQPEGIGTPYVTPLLDLVELYEFAEA